MLTLCTFVKASKQKYTSVFNFWTLRISSPTFSCRLLYAVFVVSSENATVAELAATLQADLTQLQAAASFACRLGWAVKLIDPDSVLRDSNMPSLPANILSDDEDGSNTSINSEKSGPQVLGSGIEKPRPISSTPHVAFVVDANITSYLMMGSISPGLMIPS